MTPAQLSAALQNEVAEGLARKLIEQCCIEGIRGPSGKFRLAADARRLQEAVRRLILRTMKDIEGASNIEYNNEAGTL